MGESPYWLEGLDVLGRATGLTAAVVPHWNNAEGGTHDTRFCWQGERRLVMLEDQLPDGAFVLGVDEHTGLVMDLDSGDCEVVGRGTVVVRVHGDEWIVPTGERLTIDQIAEHGRVSGAGTPEPAATAAIPSLDVAAVEAALAGGDIAGALAAVGELERVAETEAERAQVRSLIARVGASVGEPVDVTETVRPLVDVLLALRAQARADKRWSDSDAIRDGLAGAGIEVRDTPDGVEWEVRR
ncbi:MAG: hypothetical protein AB7V23_00920 [Candidatus Nanopelagicales bacterium]